MRNLIEYINEAWFKTTNDPEYWKQHWQKIEDTYVEIERTMIEWASSHQYTVVPGQDGGNTPHPVVVIGNADNEICVGVQLYRALASFCYVWKGTIYTNHLDLEEAMGVEDVPEIPTSWGSRLKKLVRLNRFEEALNDIEKPALNFVKKINKR